MRGILLAFYFSFDIMKLHIFLSVGGCDESRKKSN